MMYIVSIALGCLFIICSIIHVLARYDGKKKRAMVTKPMLMPLLLLTFLTGIKAADKTIPYLWLIIVILLLYTAGDTLLLFDSKKKPMMFLLGMGSFMIGHLCYMAWFLNITIWNNASFIAMAIVTVLVLIVLIPFCRVIIDSKIKIAPGLCIYAGLMALFCICVASTWGSGEPAGALIALFGTGFYALSDGFIAMDKTHNHIAGDDAIMTTYLLANVLLLMGVWILSSSAVQFMIF